jgi:hypothetical protein
VHGEGYRSLICALLYFEVKFKHNKEMDLHKKIKRSFSISKALGNVGLVAVGVGAVLTLAGYIVSFRVDHLEGKLNKNNNKNRR